MIILQLNPFIFNYSHKSHKFLVCSNIIKRFVSKKGGDIIKEVVKVAPESSKAGGVPQPDNPEYQEAAQSAHLPLLPDPTQSPRVEDYVMHKPAPTTFPSRNDSVSAKPLQTTVEKHKEVLAAYQARQDHASTGLPTSTPSVTSNVDVPNKSEQSSPTGSSSGKTLTPIEQKYQEALASNAHMRTQALMEKAKQADSVADPQRTQRIQTRAIDIKLGPVRDPIPVVEQPTATVPTTTSEATATPTVPVVEQPTTQMPGAATEERIPAPGSYSRPSSLSSGIIHPSVSTRVCVPPATPTVHTSPYSTHTINEPDKKTADPQAKLNDPPSPHPQFQRGQCAQLDCLDKYCPTPCGPLVARKAIGHATHGHPPAESGKKEVPLSATDLNGAAKPQQAIFYETPHDVSATKEHVQGTQRINTDLDIQNKIKQYESKK